MNLRQDADTIISRSIGAVMPGEAVRNALGGFIPPAGKTLLIAVGKAAWEMAKAALELPNVRPHGGLIITKYGHGKGPLPPLRLMEAGHPVPDENSFRAGEEVLALTEGLTENDCVIFLLSGGGSALFESPKVAPAELEDITAQLLASGAEIGEINAVRKRLSRVKGGRFGAHCAPAKVLCIILSDVLGSRPDAVASGPACPDSSKAEDALKVVDRYSLRVSDAAKAALLEPTVTCLPNVTVTVSGSVSELCAAAAKAAADLGYEPVILTDCLTCEAREAGSFLGSIALSNLTAPSPTAIIAGGETVVHVKGTGMGGRNQEIALAAAIKLAGYENAAVFSFGSDGTDGPTDAAGGFADGRTAGILREKGIDPAEALRENDAYHALSASGGLIMTGPTGTNVNDVSVILIKTAE